MAKQSLIDRWVEELSSDSKSQEESREKLIETLKEDLRDELILAAELEIEANHLIYEHLAKEARRLSREKQQLAKTIEKLIMDLGGTVDNQDRPTHVAEPDGHFRDILKLENELGERFVEQLIIAEDGGLHEAASVLIKFREVHYQHQEGIEGLIMKINTTL
ncbi:MAG: hypothetical protein HUU32_22030 [Calditrichaceae bacterium]|nr:hypothetical protein [Calditrichia bacterium]NUQ44074.1 hypothetical protein [Calditrichaceae bacterium]